MTPAVSRNPPDLTIRDLRMIMHRRWRAIIVPVIVCFVVVSLYCVLATRRYQATAVVEVERSDAESLGLRNVLTSASEESDNALLASLEQQTQSDILRSQALALRVIADLRLTGTRDFINSTPSKPSLVQRLNAEVRGRAAVLPDRADLQQAAALRTFSAHLTVTPMSGTRLIRISFEDSDPKVAAAVANNLVHQLTAYELQTRNATANRASIWLSGQLGELKHHAEEAQAQVAHLQRDSGVYSLGADAQGHDQSYSGILDRLQQATTELSQATSNRIVKGAVYDSVQKGDVDAISSLAGAGALDSSVSVQSSLSLLQTLRVQQAVLQAKLAQDSSKYGSANPKLEDEQSGLTSIEQSMQDEVKRIRELAFDDYDQSKLEEASYQKLYNDRKAEAEQLNDKAINYGIAKQEADDSRSLYEDLVRRLNETGVMEGLQSSNVTMVDPATVPVIPFEPNVKLYLAGAILAGLIFGVIGALYAETSESRVTSLDALEQSLSRRVFGALPLAPRPRPALKSPSFLDGDMEASTNSLIVIASSTAAFAEALRSLRTSLLSMTRSLPGKVILITSAVPGEGKSTVSCNLAALLAGAGKRVLLVEADLRNPSFDKYLGRPAAGVPTLNDLLSREDIRTPLNISEELPNLTILRGGRPSAQPSELLEHGRMKRLLEKLESQFDHIVLDSPPVLAVTDAVILSHLSDIALMVVRYGVTPQRALERGYAVLHDEGRTHVEVVLNAIDQKADSYATTYGYWEVARAEA